VVFNKDGSVVGIISQSDIIRFLSKNKSCLDPLRNRSLEKLGLLGEVVTVSAQEPVINVFSELYMRGITGMGVVDSNGKLIGNVSASDLRGLQWFDFASLTLSVQDFLTSAKARTVARECHSMHMRVVELHPSSTLEELITVFANSRVHRVYICEEKIPVGVVTLTDVLSVFAIHCQIDSQ